jgi:hypothetical protein
MLIHYGQRSHSASGDIDQDEKLHAEKLNHDGQLPESKIWRLNLSTLIMEMYQW